MGFIEFPRPLINTIEVHIILSINKIHKQRSFQYVEKEFIT